MDIPNPNLNKLQTVIFVFFLIVIPKIKAQSFNTNIKTGYVKSNGVNIFYKSIGKGEPIIFLHGGPGGYLAHDYPYFEKLKTHYQLIFFDQRGTGRSKCKISEKNINSDAFINDISALADHLNFDKFHLAGASWGGLLSMMYTIKNPNRVNKIVLLGSAGLRREFLSEMVDTINKRTTKEDRKKMRILENQITEKNLLEITEKKVQIFYKPYVKNYEALKAFKSNIDPHTAKVNTKVNIMVWKDIQKKGFNFYPKIKSLKNPVLMIRGDYDPISLKYSTEIINNMSGASLIRLKGIGHFPHIESNHKTLSLIKEFLQ